MTIYATVMIAAPQGFHAPLDHPALNVPRGVAEFLTADGRMGWKLRLAFEDEEVPSFDQIFGDLKAYGFQVSTRWDTSPEE